MRTTAWENLCQGHLPESENSSAFIQKQYLHFYNVQVLSSSLCSRHLAPSLWGREELFFPFYRPGNLALPKVTQLIGERTRAQTLASSFQGQGSLLHTLDFCGSLDRRNKHMSIGEKGNSSLQPPLPNFQLQSQEKASRKHKFCLTAE